MKILFNIILIFLAISFIFPWLVRWIFRMFLADQFSKAERDFIREKQAQKKREGKIKVDYVPPTKKGYEGGDYIDYEEIKE
ncbi:MAG: DUF4834 domain-containing protein [Siphonobacter sp.]